MNIDEDIDALIIVGVAAVALYLLYKAGTALNEVGTAIQVVESYL